MNNLNKFILDLQEEFEENKNLITKASKLDLEINTKLIELKEIKSILNQYLDINVAYKNSTKMVIYDGHPYLTVNVLMQAMLSKVQVLLTTDEFMLAANTVIFSVFKNVLKKHKQNIFFETQDNYSIKQIRDLESKYEEIIVIGNTSTMQAIEDLDKVKFYPYNNIILYSDSDKYESLQRIIYEYANENQYEIEIIYDEELQDIIDIINADNFVDTVILLSENEVIQKAFKDIKNKRVFINKNPFINKIGKIYNYFNI